MKFLTLGLVANLVIICAGSAAETFSGLVLPREGGGMILRNLDRSAETFAAAGAVIEDFLAAPDYKARLKFCRDPARVSALMENWVIA